MGLAEGKIRTTMDDEDKYKIFPEEDHAEPDYDSWLEAEEEEY